MLSKTRRKEIIEKFKKHPEDTGSAVVQIGLLSERINELSEHLKKHSKDFHSRRGLLMLVGKRRGLIAYLKKKDPQGYKEVADRLKLK
jgi:small subunit ribosomal protein S15